MQGETCDYWKVGVMYADCSSQHWLIRAPDAWGAVQGLNSLPLVDGKKPIAINVCKAVEKVIS